MAFTTPTGQTGKDAYVYEAAQIANAQRELDARMKRLLVAAHTEHPELFHYESDYDPELTIGATSAGKFVNYLREFHMPGPTAAELGYVDNAPEEM